MSFAFRVTRQEWDKAYENRFIQELSLHQGDVSVVNYGANGATAGTVDLRSRLATGRRSAGLLIPDHTIEAKARLDIPRL